MVNVSEGRPVAAKAEIKRTAHWIFSRRGPAFLGPISRLGDKSIRRIAAYVQKGQVVADVGCGWGYYSFALADMVGPKGRVYAVDLARKCIQAIKNKAEKRGCQAIEAHESTAADLSFIKDKSVDFVIANGLLCSMAVDRPSAVAEIKRILKPAGQAYLSLGAVPPWGYVDRAEWSQILEGFRVDEGGAYEGRWAIVENRVGKGDVEGPER
jgi:2-polyprenyl-3-methyl-5-hydroxy-6-metoxy-1,4-benzoquinol methylase